MEYKKALQEKLQARTEDEGNIFQVLCVFLQCVDANYHNTLSQISNLISDGLITFDFLYAIFTPGSILLEYCPFEKELRAMRLISWDLQLPHQFYNPYRRPGKSDTKRQYALHVQMLSEATVKTLEKDGESGALLGARFGMLQTTP